ncbi:hypothetical protein AVEN_221662-1 [Araneus ventricosus]|uniref:Uncharacterized protein n=1 Tax=Araneus ventricosus TaxID=182803 RepID=A0A4Y2GSW9_ARAVE|nr:hypothetical protein AVEN_221662-1 [Araneus ventricosus]
MTVFLSQEGPQWPSGKVTASGPAVPGSKPDSTGDAPCMWAWCALNMTSSVKLPHSGVVREDESFGERGASSGILPRLACWSRQESDRSMMDDGACEAPAITTPPPKYTQVFLSLPEIASFAVVPALPPEALPISPSSVERWKVFCTNKSHSYWLGRDGNLWQFVGCKREVL